MGFLGKARKMIGGKGAAEPPKPQYYQVACVEGHVIRGERTEGYQALRCPHCGDGVFVLPRSPLPLPSAPAASRSKRTARSAPVEDRPIELADAPPQEDLEEIQWLEPEPDPAGPPARPGPAARAQATDRSAPSVEPILEAVAAEAAEPPAPRPRPKSRPGRSRPKPIPVAVAPDEEETPGRIAVPARSRRQAPVLWLTLGVVALVIGTIGFRVWRQRLQDLPHEAEVNRVEGIAALEKGQFDEARAKLGRAARAYKDLGVHDEVAVTTFQAADEAAILAGLSHDQLKEIVEEVARLGDPDGIAKFHSIHKGQSQIIDSKVMAVRQGVAELDYKIFVGRGPVPSKKGRLDLSGFKLFEGSTLPRKDDQVLFGARLDSIRLEDGEWVITLEPDSGVLMTNEKALQAAGFASPGSAEPAT